MKYLIDSSAWIEYLEGSLSGEMVNKILKEQNEIYTTSLNIAEVVSKVKRKRGNSELAYEAIIKNSEITNITPKIAHEAGLLHASMKNKILGFSLADALIIKSAQNIKATILTTDNHFKQFKEAIII